MRFRPVCRFGAHWTVASILAGATAALATSPPTNGIGPVLPAGVPVPSIPEPSIPPPLTPAPRPPPPPTSKPATTQPADPLAPLPWHAKLQDAIDEAQKSGKPILVDVGAAWCGWCKKLDAEFTKPPVQQRLGNWVRVKIDVDRDPDTARQLSVAPIPALRVLAPTGRVVASRDGYLAADDLLKWLDEQQPRASLAGEALGGEPADAAAAEALVTRIVDADPIVREAATRRLIKHPSLAAPKVAEAFATGNLATRLAALELLQDWKAPVGGMDPWESSTLTKERLDALKVWATEKAKAGATTQPATQPAALTSEQLNEARRDLAIMRQAATETESQAARERLARLGPSLLPEIYAALKTVTADRDRERLVALRYRVVASDTLVLGWPGGFDRLASVNPTVRHAAVEELTARVKAGDQPLLLELFGDSDPFVRERSLKLLHSIGGRGVSAGLVRLLKDPELNVRAAVLKQLAEQPTPGMDAEVAAFTKVEKDTDLVVHAVRVLREAKTLTAAMCLRDLLAHESWRVRAEAAESLGKLVGNYNSGPLSTEQKADTFAAMIKLLDDPDEFVVSRALIVLRDAKLASAIEPMVKAAERRPELTPEVVKSLGQSPGPASEKHLRRYCKDASPVVRSLAIAALCDVAGSDGCAAEMTAALQDADPKVQTAAAATIVRLFEKSRPTSSSNNRSIDYDAWLTRFRGGEGWPQWAKSVQPILQKLATTPGDAPAAPVAGKTPMSTVAAVALAAMAKDDVALPVLREAAAGTKEQRAAAAKGLEWLPWEQRLALYKLLAAKANRDERLYLMNSLTTLPTPAAAPMLWEVLAAPDSDAATASAVYGHLLKSYLGDRYYSLDDAKPEKTKPLADAALAKIESGTELQRTAALAALVAVAPDQATKAAKKLLGQPGTAEGTRGDAFHVMLLTATEKDGRAAAIEVLKKPGRSAWEQRKTAVRYLTGGTNQMGALRGQIYLNMSSRINRVVSMSVGEPEAADVPKAVAGLTAEMLRPLAADTADKEAAACANYLLVLLGDRAAFDPLVTYWREHERADDQWQRLVAGAVVLLGEDALVPVLEEIYNDIAVRSSYRASEFYRIIRPMTGANILKLRKRMRDEIGADVLR